MLDKYFTLEEANALLPVIREQLAKLQDIKRRFEEKYTELQQLREADAGEDIIFSRECEIEFLQIEAKTYIKNFQNKGVQLKSIEMGLVDFPALIDGEEVFLCWKQGEETITHYHGVDDGFAGRKKLF
jgi:hypothetical protein